LAAVSEVISTPDHIVALPHTDAAMLGVLSWRGALLPVVSTRVLLGRSAEMPMATSRIVIVRVGEGRVGLVVDEVSSIMRATADAVGAVPRVLNRGAGEGKIDAMLRQASGGLVSILAPERLFRDDSLAQILEDGRVKDEQMQAKDARASEKLLIFTLANERYGLPIQAVEEIVNLPTSLTRIPRAPAFLAGVMNLRGQVVPVVDQRQRFGAPTQEGEQRRRVIVTRLRGLLCGFAVDTVSELIDVDADAMDPTPSLAAEGGELFDRTAQLEAGGGVILVVNPQVMLDQAERDLLQSLVDSGALNSA
jgi:purine-binding chemotaxis protein CheW